MNQLPDTPLSLPALQSADALLVLHEMLRPGTWSTTTPEIRFLAMLAIRRPSELRQVDVQALAAAMIAWGQRHLGSEAIRSSIPDVLGLDRDPGQPCLSFSPRSDRVAERHRSCAPGAMP